MDTVVGISSLQLHSNEWGKIYYHSHLPDAQKTKRSSWGYAVLEYYAENPVQASLHKKMSTYTFTQNSPEVHRSPRVCLLWTPVQGPTCGKRSSAEKFKDIYTSQVGEIKGIDHVSRNSRENLTA